jgi:hypothetical protein
MVINFIKYKEFLTLSINLSRIMFGKFIIPAHNLIFLILMNSNDKINNI